MGKGTLNSFLGIRGRLKGVHILWAGLYLGPLRRRVEAKNLVLGRRSSCATW